MLSRCDVLGRNESGDTANVRKDVKQGRLRGIGERGRVVETSHQKQSMNPGTPFMMIAKAYNRGLIFIHAKTPSRIGGIVILVQIPAVRLVLLDLQINGVLRRELSFERQGQLPLFDVIVHLLAGVGA